MAGLITTKIEMREYIRMMLGYPTIDVEITDEQLDWIIYDSIEKFAEYAGSGVSLNVMTIPLVEDQDLYILTDDVYAILEVFNLEGSGITAAFPDKVLSNLVGQTLTAPGSGTILSYELNSQFLDTVRSSIQVPLIYTYNQTTKELNLLDSKFDERDSIGVLFYKKVTEESNNVFNEPWIKKYSVASAKSLWGFTLGKYEGSLLPEGLTMNPGMIRETGDSDMEKLETELVEIHAEPSSFYAG